MIYIVYAKKENNIQHILGYCLNVYDTFYQLYAGKPMFIDVQCSAVISLSVCNNFYFLKHQHRVRDLSSRASLIAFGTYLSFRHMFINKGYRVSSCLSFLQNLNVNASRTTFSGLSYYLYCFFKATSPKIMESILKLANSNLLALYFLNWCQYYLKSTVKILYSSSVR